MTWAISQLLFSAGIRGWMRSLTSGESEIPEMDRETHDLLKALGYVE